MVNFDINNAIVAAKLSALAYSERLTKNKSAFELELRELGFKSVAIFDNLDTDTQGFVASNDSISYLIFRGTYETPRDVLSDVSARLVNGFHEGFYQAVGSVETDISNALDAIKNLPLISAGHSLGGALAQLAILRWPTKNWQGCYTFGSPPVCDEPSGLNNKVPSYRIVNEGDIVSRVLDLHEVPELKEFYQAAGGLLHSLAGWVGTDSELGKQVARANSYAQEVIRDQVRYCHFGDVVIIGNDGMIVTKEDSIAAFRRVFNAFPDRIFKDHSIDRYIANLERYGSFQTNLLRGDTSRIDTKDVNLSFGVSDLKPG